MSERREFNIPNILAGNTSRFQRVDHVAAYYNVWVLNNNEPIAVRDSPMKLFEFPIYIAALKETGPLEAEVPAKELDVFIALSIQQGLFKEVA